MAEIEEECIFDVLPDHLTFTTARNGDKILMKGLDFNEGQAATIAWLINKNVQLVVQIKQKVT